MPTVLVIENNESIIILLDTILRRGGYHMTTARSSMDGLAAARSSQPDVILLEERLPIMSGEELCLQLRSDPQTAPIPIILTTTATIQNLNGYIERTGVNVVLRKPFRPDDVLKALKAALGAGKQPCEA